MCEPEANDSVVRVVRTARTEDEINDAARAGYKPLVKPVCPSRKINSKFAIIQNRRNGEIEVLGDFRALERFPSYQEEWDLVVPFTSYYPHQWDKPFAAYLLPPDLHIGERVMLVDLIEDLVGHRWNQGDAFRLNSCEAIWNGKYFEIMYDEQNVPEMLG